MPTLSKQTPNVRKEDASHDWWIVDASDQTVGRLATRVASVLSGKTKGTYTPHVDVGDYVVIVNADKIKFTGRKLQSKNYYRHSGYTGGLTTTSAEKMLAEKPEQVITKAVRGMLPKNRLARQMISKLKVYAGSEHPHIGQQPQPLTFE